VNASLELPIAVGAALLASAEGYTPRATQLIEAARVGLGTVQETAGALAENLPQPKLTSGRSRRRKRRKRKKSGTQPQNQQNQQNQQQAQQAQEGQQQEQPAEAKKPKPRARKKPAPKAAEQAPAETPAA
jgi:outer membrane biosynthesis protein TonB